VAVRLQLQENFLTAGAGTYARAINPLHCAGRLRTDYEHAARSPRPSQMEDEELKNNTKTIAALALLAAAVSLSVQGAEPAPKEIEILYVGDKADPAWLGASQGLTEANQQGKFLGTTFRLTQLPGAGDVLNQAKPAAAVVALDAATLAEVAKALPDTPVFNVSLDDDDLRARCGGNILHVQPSKAMKRDALSQWKTKHPESNAAALAWHSSAVKYAGLQLNKRYRQSSGKDMDDHAWAGWAAVKMLSDTVVRTQSGAGTELLEFMKTRLRFDGQKGADMSFRPNGQLRQPILLVEDGKIVGEAPVPGVSKGSDDLDSLGNVECSP
jgi:hypothetical protein